MTKVKIHINGKQYETEPGNNLLHTCLALGFDIPYFCYHPALGSVGACRQCAVKKYRDESDKKGRIIMSCMEPVIDGLIISTDDEEVLEFRRSVIEALMINHPHDCPVCDEGSECHLQDMTVMTGHAYRRYDFKKRTYRNQYMGQFISHEMNRCIQCYRCVRYYRDYAGGRDLHVFGSAGKVYFGRHEEGALESIFSGNLVEVCPTGVFTDKTFSNHYTRKWDLTNSPSICNNCSVGCNTILSSRYGTVRRVRSRYNGEVNGYFLCDRGRFGYEYINSSERIRKPVKKEHRYSEPAEIAGERLKSALIAAIKGRRIAGIGSPRASLESNFALLTLTGKDNFYHGVTGAEFELIRTALRIMKENPAHTPSLSEIEKSDAVLILGEDPVKTAPMMALAIRQASRNSSFEVAAAAGVPAWNDAAVRDIGQDARSPVFIASLSDTRLDDITSGRFRGNQEKIAALGSLIASSIDNSLPAPKSADYEIKEMAENIAGILINARNPLIITGMETKSINILQAAADISTALSLKGKKPNLAIIFPYCNSAGLGMLDGKSVDELMKPVLAGELDTLIILESNLYNIPAHELAESLFEKCTSVIVLHHSRNETTERADIVLPSGTFAESTGTIINYEGRAQRYYRVLPEDEFIKDKWKHLAEILRAVDGNPDHHWYNFDDIVKSLITEFPEFGALSGIMPSSFRYFGEKVPRQQPRFSGRTAIDVNVNVHEPKSPEDPDSPLNFSMEGFSGVPSSYLVPFYWSPGWNSPQAITKYLNEPGGFPPDGNPGVLLFSEKENKTEYFSKKK
jgi:NADH-quinone oxidoreductase subunit G